MSVGKRIAIVAYSSASIGLIGYGDYLLGQLGIEEWLATQNITKSMFLTIVAGIYGSIVAHGSIILAQLYRTATTQRIARTLTLVALPANITITVIYWPLYLFLRHLIAEKSDFQMPLVTDLLVHFVPGVTLLLYTLCLEESRRVRVLGRDLAKYVAVAVCYVAWIEYKAFENRDRLVRYPYPFLNVAGDAGRVGIYVAATAISWIAYVLITRVK